MDSGGGNTGSSDPAKTSTAENAANSLPGCGCSSANNITVRVTPTTGGQFDLQVAKTESVENFKKLISKKLKVPKERICLLHRDRQLREGTLQENQLMDGSRLTLLPSVETGLLAQRPEQSVMQALESLNDTQVNDFLSGKAPLNLTMRLGDHMMLIQLQLSTVTPSSSRRSSGGSSSSTSTSSTSTPAASAGSSSSSSSSSPAFSASPSPSPSASPSKSSFGAPTAPAAAGVSSPLPPSLASPSLSSVIAAAAGSLAAMNSCSSPNGGGFAPDSSRTVAWGSKAPSSAVPTPTPAPASPRTPFSAAPAAPADVPAFHPASPCAAAPSPDASPHPSPLKFLEEAANLLPKPPPPAPPSAADGPAPAAASAVTAVSTAAAAPATASSPSFQQASTSASATSSTSSSSASSSQHSCAFGAGSSACKCDAPSAKPTLDTRALAEASRNLTQTLKQLSSEVLTSRSDAAEDSTRGGRRQGAIIESMHHHGKGVYSGTFSGTLNPALQDRYGRPKRDISTIIHILNDLLCATPQYRRHTRQGHSISVETSGSTVPKKGTNTSDKSSSNLEFMEDSGSLSRENQATRGKMEHLRLIMEERRARRRARREARAAPYTTQWSAKSESLPQSSAMGHDTVEPMETGEQSSSSSSSEQQLCELNPPEPVVA